MQRGEAEARLAVSDFNSGEVHVYDARSGSNDPLTTLKAGGSACRRRGRGGGQGQRGWHRAGLFVCWLMCMVLGHQKQSVFACTPNSTHHSTTQRSVQPVLLGGWRAGLACAGGTEGV